MTTTIHRLRRVVVAVTATALITTACAPSGIQSTHAATAPSAGTSVSQGHHDHTNHDHMKHAAHAHCDAHDGDPSRRAEHCAAMDLTDPATATAMAMTSGLWSDPGTWGGALPTDGAGVHIPEGTTVTIDDRFASRLDWIRIDGVLAFSTDTDSELLVDTVVSSPSGLFQMGTPQDPIPAGITARVLVIDDGPIDRTVDPGAIGRGLVLHGRTVIHGADRTAFVELAAPARTGDTTLQLLTAPQGWVVGDELVIAGSASDASGDEVATIASIAGATVTLNTPLASDHIGPAQDLNVHVANLTRNAVIDSESDDIERRGHVMFMHTTDVDVANAGFYRLGRTNKLEELTDRLVDQGTTSVCVATTPDPNVRGRYSVHFHRAGVIDTPVGVVRGSVATDNPGWAYVNHSSNVDFIDNVAYDVDGAAFNTESGDEIGSFRGNISIRTLGTGGDPTERQASQDFGHEGHGFWFQGAGVSVEDNVAAGATGAGFIFYQESLVEPHAGRVFFPAQNLSFDAAGHDLIPVTHVPLVDFRRNEAYGSEIGARTYYHRTDIATEPDEVLAIADQPLGFPESRVEDLTIWSTNTGWMSSYTIDTVFSNLRIVGDGGGDVGFDASNVYNRGVHRYEGLDISGFEIGLFASVAGDVTIDGGRFDNTEHNILLTPPRQVDRRVLVTGEPAFGGSAPEVSAVADLRIIVDGDDLWYLLDDRIILDYGRFNGEQLFYAEQSADTVLFAEQPIQAIPDDPGAPIEDEIIGLTNTEIKTITGSSLGGAFTTPDASEVAGVVGLVGTPAPDPGPLQSAEQQMRSEFPDDLDAGELAASSSGTVTAADCEEYAYGLQADDELIEECTAVFEGRATDVDEDLAAECDELRAELDGAGSDEQPLDLRAELEAEIADLSAQEIEEYRAECTEFLSSDEAVEEPEYAEECRIFLEVVGS